MNDVPVFTHSSNALNSHWPSKVQVAILGQTIILTTASSEPSYATIQLRIIIMELHMQHSPRMGFNGREVSGQCVGLT